MKCGDVIVKRGDSLNFYTVLITDPDGTGFFEGLRLALAPNKGKPTFYELSTAYQNTNTLDGFVLLSEPETVSE